MKTLYALIFACLSLQACIDQSKTPAVSTNINEYSSIVEYAGAVPLYDDHEHTAVITTTSAVRPIDGAEFAGTSRDDAATPWASMPHLDRYAIDWSADEDEHTAAVISPASRPTTAPVAAGTDFLAEDEGWDFTVPQAADLHAIQTKDWW
jgi:hypothetical protein